MLGLLLFWGALTIYARVTPAQELADLLQSFLEQQAIHPDSLYPNIQKMESRRSVCSNPTERAVVSAVLGYLYSEASNSTLARRYQTVSDSTQMQEWSREDFRRISASRFAESLSDFDLLHRAKLKDWAPLLKKGKDDIVFGSDMLAPVWHTARNVIFGRQASLPSYASIITYYKEQGYRDAALKLTLDSLHSAQFQMADLLKLRDEYQDLAQCAEIYYELASAEDSLSRRVAWLEEGISRYPKYRQRGKLQQFLQSTISPNLQFDSQNSLYYPSEQIKWPVSARNLTKLNFELYQVGLDYETGNFADQKIALKYVLQHGKRVNSWTHAFQEHPRWEMFPDTISFTTPSNGRYVLVVYPYTDEKLVKEPTPSMDLFNVSGLFVTSIDMPDNWKRLIVTDCKSGAPIKGASVKIYAKTRRNRADTTIVYYRQHTDERGVIEFRFPKDDRGRDVRQLIVHVERPGDLALPDATYWRGNVYAESHKDTTQRIDLYTDRKIYRPGQTIHLAGLVSKHYDWDEAVVSGKELEVVFYDAHRKKLDSRQLIADEMGVFSGDFEIPSPCDLGNYSFRVGNSASIYVRVEEYKRPTFEVKTDEAPALQLPADSITLTGRAVTYAGVPVRNAIVSGEYRWRDRFWYWRNRSETARQPIDTCYTDEEGRFSVRVPIVLNKEEMRLGRCLSVNYTVTSETGESHDAEQFVTLSTTPLVIEGIAPRLNDKESMKPWSIKLYSSTGKEVAGQLVMELRNKQGVAWQGQKSSGSLDMKELLALPSGSYELYVKGISEGDTASWHQTIVLFSQSDTQLPLDTTFWFYAPKTKFSKGNNARVQVGSSLRDVHLYYMLQSNEEVIVDTVIQFSDSLLTLDVPYEEWYDKGVVLNVCFVHDGILYRNRCDITLHEPNKELLHKWITFRDKLQPGQRETWELLLMRPDSTAASANLMMAMYDASLDVFAANNWHFGHAFGFYLRSHSFVKQNVPHYSRVYSNFEMKQYRWKDFSFSMLNPELFSQRVLYDHVSRGGVMYKTAAVAMNAAPLEAKVLADVATEEMADGIAETAVAEETVEEPEPVVQMRENFDETAFFYPQLRTNGEGKVSISFTLPESLTSWRLLGLAHTQDLMTTTFREDIVAQKDLMAQLYLPRFLRPGDEATLTASISNITDQNQSGRAMLKVMDAETERVLKTWKVNISLEANADSTYQFEWEVPSEYDRLIVKWVAEGKTCSDGEQRLLPVLPDEEWITNTRAITGYGVGMSKEDISKLFPKDCSDRKLTVEYTTHPEQLALQALPALAKSDRNNVLSLASAYYAIRLAQKLGVEVPDSAGAYLKRIQGMQLEDGSFSWYPCGNYRRTGSAYLTREVCFLLTRLQMMTGKTGADVIYSKAVSYLIEENEKRIAEWKKDGYKPKELHTYLLRNLYVILFSNQTLSKSQQRSVDYLVDLLKNSTQGYDLEGQALASIVLQKAGEQRKARKCLELFRTRLVTTAERGTYIEFPQGNFSSVDRKLHIHVQLMEAVQDVIPDSVRLLSGMRRYLLQQKRTQQWDTPVTSASAIFALCNVPAKPAAPAHDVLTLLDSRQRVMVNIIPQDDTLGYVRDSVLFDDSSRLPAALRLQKFSEGESWGAVYADFLQPISLVEKSSTGLNLRVEFPDEAQKGKKIVARYVITADRDYDFVDLEVPRPATLEPVSQLSGYRWQNSIGYYQEVHDHQTEYHFQSIPRGTYVIEEEFYVEREGRYNAGIPTLRCSYAKEYQAHFENQTVTVR